VPEVTQSEENQKQKLRIVLGYANRVRMTTFLRLSMMIFISIIHFKPTAFILIYIFVLSET